MSTTSSVIAKRVVCGRCLDRNWDGRADDLGVLETIESSDALAFYARSRTSTPWLSDDGFRRSRLETAIVIGTRDSPSVRRSFEFHCRSGCGAIGVKATRLRRLFDDSGDEVRIR